MDEAVDFQLIEQPREMTIGQLTEAYREVLGSLEENRAEQKLLNQQKSDLAIEVMRRCEAEGIDKLSGRAPPPDHLNTVENGHDSKVT